ncbi:exodeoxyribonuclease VII large subunit [Nicoletella semolina]|uniref:Exodeoxyribonuclease 7 large subunit n=1 Tax=Nicoletella semolina TaxID=271160 RepID=A0A4R2NAE1_9PAST|nr:exodeoxyribonuclease VII large subunit [Nicoletella semolina]MDH2923940.1 exodeoxyribonuclease VII large subunit [Nicoletella semolina]TCP18061.1 exodeoxyribonuclease VII large subunit [Nicoletella semolina]
MQQNIFTVTQLNGSIKQLLETEFGHIWLVGEISNFSCPVSGHWYLTLKDEHAQVRCAMFRMKNLRVAFRPQNGLQVLVRASVSLYEPRGDYQVIIESMQLAGEGVLQQQFEALKNKLSHQGWFDPSHKKSLPTFIRRIGVITSSNGAALQDILSVLQRRDPTLEVIIYPSLVQGKEAAGEIVKMIELANRRQECEVLIVGRGGGSLEDLWCFNEEVVAQAIYYSSLPIVSAVGHEVDFTIADFVADIRAATPSAAAELVSRDRQEWIRRLSQLQNRTNLAFDRLWNDKLSGFAHLNTRLNAQNPLRIWQQQHKLLSILQQRLARAMTNLLAMSSTKFARLSDRLHQQQPQQKLRGQQQQLNQMQRRLQKVCRIIVTHQQNKLEKIMIKLDQSALSHQLARYKKDHKYLQQRLRIAMVAKLRQRQQQFQSICLQLDNLSPLNVLSRGYSVTLDSQGRALINPQAVKIGEKITTTLSQGEIVSEVTAIYH